MRSPWRSTGFQQSLEGGEVVSPSRRGSSNSRSSRWLTRLYFCTDLHGSEVCFRKFLHAGAAYRAQTIVMGGDCTGKMAVPFVADGAGYRCAWESGPKGIFEPGGPLEAAERLV